MTGVATTGAAARGFAGLGFGGRCVAGVVVGLEIGRQRELFDAGFRDEKFGAKMKVKVVDDVVCCCFL